MEKFSRGPNKLFCKYFKQQLYGSIESEIKEDAVIKDGDKLRQFWLPN